MSKKKGIKQPTNGYRGERRAYRFAGDAPGVRGYRQDSTRGRLVNLLMDGKWHKLDELERAFPKVNVRQRLSSIQRNGPYALDSEGQPRPWRLNWAEDKRSVRLVVTRAVKVSVEIINIPVSGADWKFALQAEETELPALTEEQKAFVRSLRIREQDYARQVLARKYAEVRYRGYAEEFGRLLAKAASCHSVESVRVIYDLSEGRFYCRLTRDDSVTLLRLSADLVTVPLEQGDPAALGQAEKAIERSLKQAAWVSRQEVRRTAVGHNS